MTISDLLKKASVEIFVIGIRKHLFQKAKANLLEMQKTEYEQRLAEIIKKRVSRDVAIKAIGEFIADEVKAEQEANGYLDNGIGDRLFNATKCYASKDHIGCVRGILLALETAAFLYDGEEHYKKVRDLNNKLLASF